MLGTLLHEQIHLWRDLYGTLGKGTYHNRELVRKAWVLGVPCVCGRGSSGLGYFDPFVAPLQREGIEIEVQSPNLASPVVIAPPPQSSQSKLKRWSCGCVNIWAVVDVRAHCLQCGRSFAVGAKAGSNRD